MFIAKSCLEELDGELLKCLGADLLKLPTGITPTFKSGGAWALAVGKLPGTCLLFAFIGVEVELEPAKQALDVTEKQVAAG